MARQIQDHPDKWYAQAKQELRLMELLDQSGPMTVESMIELMGLEDTDIWIMLYGLGLAECVRLNRKTRKFSLVPVEVPEQLGLEL